MTSKVIVTALFTLPVCSGALFVWKLLCKITWSWWLVFAPATAYVLIDAIILMVLVFVAKYTVKVGQKI